jgi:carboxymethylenebutenolidase
MSGTEIMIEGADGAFMAYRNGPKGAPAVVVIQEIFGVNPFIRTVVDRMAGLGYDAVAPDLFWRIEPGVNITDKTEEEWKKAFDLYSKFDVAKGVEDIQATISFMRETSPKVGATGYCLGGLLAYLTACRTDADASVSYYGVGIDQMIGEAKGIKKPLLVHIAAEDGFVSKDAQAAIHAGLAGVAGVTIHFYPGMDHAFTRIGGAHYNEEAAALANGRTADFFAAALA